MKKSTAKNKMIPDQNALNGIPARDPHADFVKKDAMFKKRRGAQG